MVKIHRCVCMTSVLVIYLAFFLLQCVHSLAGSWSHNVQQWNCLPLNAMSGWHYENDVKRVTVRCYPWIVDCCCTWSDIAAGISACLSKYAFVFSTRLVSSETVNFVSLKSQCFPLILSQEMLRLSGKQNSQSPGDQSLSVNYCCRVNLSFILNFQSSLIVIFHWLISLSYVTIQNAYLTSLKNYIII